MPARVLVVDDVPTNRLLLRFKLTGRYFEVLEAPDGEAALDIARREDPDLILLDVMMPGLDGIETCRRLKSDPRTRHIPVMMLTALDKPQDRVLGLEAGADDFLSKPHDDDTLFARVNNLVRIKVTIDELRLRHASSPGADGAMQVGNAMLEGASLLIVCNDDAVLPARIRAIRESLRCAVHIASGEREMRALIETTAFDCVIIGPHLSDGEPMRLASFLRARPQTRRIPVLMVFRPDDAARAHLAMGMGVADCLFHPADPSEFIARVRVQIRQKAYSDQLRDAVSESIALATRDPLTGLANRRDAMARLSEMVARAAATCRPVAVMMLDLDGFKSVNDRHGHAAGDAVLRDIAHRLPVALRAGDLVARVGGEEFLVALPDTGPEQAAEIAERIRLAVERAPVRLAGGKPVRVTVSIGLAVHQPGGEAAALIDAADAALYASKRGGRNTVTRAASAA
ncbi:MAG: PleD family two-component system response regulator [Thermohalobaculum sp.]|nr:PleD family two-component system response regulator [Thermohalobaculum sp.]